MLTKPTAIDRRDVATGAVKEPRLTNTRFSVKSGLTFWPGESRKTTLLARRAEAATAQEEHHQEWTMTLSGLQQGGMFERIHSALSSGATGARHMLQFRMGAYNT